MKDRPPRFRLVKRDDPPRLAGNVPPPPKDIPPDKNTDLDQDHDEDGDD